MAAGAAAANPRLLLVHGLPNSSFDYYRLIPLLEQDYHIAVLDFPGSGLSDKPQDGFSYLLEDNARRLPGSGAVAANLLC